MRPSYAFGLIAFTTALLGACENIGLGNSTLPPEETNGRIYQNYLGTQTYIYWNNWDLGEFEKSMALAQKIGMKYMRIDAAWSDIERDGKMDADTLVLYQKRDALIRKYGMQPVYIASTSHAQYPETEWAANKTGYPVTAKDQTAFANFIVQFAKAIGPHAMIEIANEPNLFTSDTTKVDAFIKNAQIVRQALKRAQLKNKILGPAVSIWQDGNPDHISALSFMRRVAEKAPDSFDIYTIHLYNGIGRAEDNLPKLKEAMAIAEKAGKKDVWVETGYSSAPNTPYAISESKQASRLLTAITLYRRAGAKVVVTYELSNRDNQCIDRNTGGHIIGCRAPEPSEGGFGMANNDLTLKFSGKAIREFTHTP